MIFVLFDKYITRTKSNINEKCEQFILFYLELRQRGRFAGFSLFVSNDGVMDNSSLCYKDGPQLPPLNFTTTCFTLGRYVYFYNERLDGVVYPEGYELIAYTELCEVIVQGRKEQIIFFFITHIFCGIIPEYIKF